MNSLPDPANLFLAYGSVILLLLLCLSILFGKIDEWYSRWRASVMSRQTKSAKTVMVREAVPVPVVPIGAELVPDDDGDIMPRVSRRLSDQELITLLAAQRTPEDRYRFSANQIAAFVGGLRADVLARVRAVRETPPPLQFLDTDTGGRVPASYPVSGRRT